MQEATGAWLGPTALFVAWSFQFTVYVLQREKASYYCKSIKSPSDGWDPTKLSNKETQNKKDISSPQVPRAAGLWKVP